MRFDAYVKLTLRGNTIRRFINLCTAGHIKLWDIRYMSENKYEVCCKCSRLWDMKPYLDKTHTSITVSEKMGYYHLAACLKKTRWIWGILMNALILMLILSIRIWNIRINGNKSLSDITIIDYVNKNNVPYGCISQKNYAWLEKSIENEFSDVVWCSIYVDGTTLMIEISEGITYPK